MAGWSGLILPSPFTLHCSRVHVGVTLDVLHETSRTCLCACTAHPSSWQLQAFYQPNVTIDLV